MYYLIDEIILPAEHEQTFLNCIEEFRNLYLKVPGVTAARYLKTTLEAFTKHGIVAETPGAENLVINLNPVGSYLLMIVFESQQKFQDYHDNSTLSKQIHQQISGRFAGKQLTIRAALHGNEI